MKTLIALIAIAAGAIADGSPEVAAGATFDASDPIADSLIAAGDARVYVQVPPGKTVKARLLIDGQHGRANDVVRLPADDAQRAQNAGVADSDPAAVAWAQKLPQNLQQA